MWIALTCIGMCLSGLAPAAHTARSCAPVATKHAVLEIMSLDSGDLGLQLAHRWGAISARHVYFDNHDGSFEAVVEPSADGVRITFRGWEEHPFVAKAARIRMVYQRRGAERVDVLAETMANGEVRIRPVGQPPIHGRKVVARLGGPEARYFLADHK
jgi:hypothetical protein